MYLVNKLTFSLELIGICGLCSEIAHRTVYNVMSDFIASFPSFKGLVEWHL